MRYYLIIMLLLTTLTNAQVQPPKPEKIKKEITTHGHTRIDDYFWMNERENPKVLEFLKAENDYMENALSSVKELRENLYNEIVGRIKKDDESVPYKFNSYWYYSKFSKGEEYPVYYRKKEALTNPEEIIINVNELAKGFAYYSVGGLSISPDNKLAAYSVDTLSRRKYSIFVKDLTNNKLLPDYIENTSGQVAWANDNKTFFYVAKDENLREYKLFKHVLGTKQSEDEEIFFEADDTYALTIGKSASRKYIIVESSTTLTDECLIIDADNPNQKIKVFSPRERGIKYSIDHLNGKFYILTNHNALNFRFMESDESSTNYKQWKEVIPHRSDVLLEGFSLFNDFYTLQEREKGLNKIRIIGMKDKIDYQIDFKEEAYSAFIGHNPEPNTKKLRYMYTSLTTPSSTIEYDMENKTQTVLKEEEVVGGYDKTKYHTERLYAKADDGTLVPISLVYRKDLKKNGNNPLLLYGYGSYGISTNPIFSSTRISLLDRGFIYAIAHIRGGQELGRQWYEDGKLLKKMNTFTDFISCGEHLINQKYTTKKNLYAMGGSAGGLLMGAVSNMRPDLFKGIVAVVPFVDVVTTMLDSSIPLTTFEYDEWGNPNDKQYYEYMLKYSPYDNIEPKNYPNMLVMTGLHDSQVQYWEPAKWVAKLRELKKDNNLLLFHTNLEAGHGGASGRFQRFKDVATQYAFLLMLSNVNQ